MAMLKKFSKIAAGVVLGLTLAGLAAVAYLYFLGGGTVSTPDISSWFPFGGENNDQESNSGTDTSSDASADDSSPLQKISSAAVSGATVLGTANHRVLFVERENGNLFEYDLPTKTAVRLSNTTIPRIQKALFTADGSKVALQYVSVDEDGIETYLANVPTMSASSSEEIALTGRFLPRNLVSLSAHPSNASMFYLAPSASGVQGFKITTAGTAQNIYTSKLSEWNTQWVSDTRIALTTKASGLALGYLYLFNTGTGGSERIMGNVAGLTTKIAPDGKTLLYSETVQNSVALRSYNIETEESTPLLLHSLPEKCVWSKKNPDVAFCGVSIALPRDIYPDAWYQGIVFFTDDLWKINTKTAEAELLFDLSTLSKSEIDVVDPVLSSDESLLIFRNKRDSSLWSLDLPTP